MEKRIKRNNKIPRKWIKQALSTTLAVLFFVITINYINDPLWVFNKENFTNKNRIGFNERQQKSNLIYFSGRDYDSVLVGNSKSTYINQYKFEPGKLFNYSVSAMNIGEYEGYINFFKKTTKNEPKYIIFGVDFVTCLGNKTINFNQDEESNSAYQDPKFYTNDTSSKLYKFKHLLSYDTFMYSLRNFAMSLDRKKTLYDQHNVKVKVGFKQSEESNLQEKLVEILKNPPTTFENGIYNQNLTNILQKIRKDNPKSKFIVIFLPDFMPVFTINNNKPIYNKCVSELTGIFGEKNIFNFMKLNEMTVNSNNYYDGAHFRDYIGDFILDKISAEINKNKSDFQR